MRSGESKRHNGGAAFGKEARERVLRQEVVKPRDLANLYTVSVQGGGSKFRISLTHEAYLKTF